MKATPILAFGMILSLAGMAQAADTQNAEVSTTPKNLARQHLGANLLVFNATSKTYEPTEAAAAWLDDDIATGWPAMTGHQDYLLALQEPQLINNFSISARSVAGTVSLYAGDELAPPSAKSWTLLEKNVPIASINEKMGKTFGRFAKYILIETDLTESGPWYSLYLYGDKASSAYAIQQRAHSIDPRTVFGPYTNPQTSISLSSLYAHSRVTLAGGDRSTWQQAIDDNPQTGVFMSASKDEAGLAVHYDRTYMVQRVSVLTDAGAKGKLEFFLLNGPENRTAAADSGSHYIRVANNDFAQPESVAAPAGENGIPVSDLHPVATMTFDGSNARGSVDFSAAAASTVVARWTPDTAGQPLNVREINSFGDVALNDYELAPAPDTVSEGPVTQNETGGKETLGPDGKETLGKETLPPAVGEALPLKTPFIPGVPIFPPTIPMSP